VSLIGTLEQFNLSSVLQRVETHAKTGLLIVKQGAHWVEFYFREGRLICIGPVRTNATLGERLLQDGIVSAQALQQALFAIGSDQLGETRTARTLMDMGLVEHSALRAWATQKAIDVLQVLLLWTSGEIYFEDEVPPPPDRLLVALSASALLSSMSVTGPTAVPQAGKSGFFSPSQPTERIVHTPPPDAAKLPTLMSASQFFQETPAPMVSLPGIEAFVPPVLTPASSSSPARPSLVPASALLPTTESLASPSAPLSPATESLPSFFDMGLDEGNSTNSTLSRPERVVNPVPPKRIDTSFMRPDMVLAPVDLSAFREQNPPIQLTPDQWRLLTRVDGRTSLQVACQELRVAPALVCRVAGELLAEGLIQLIPPGSAPIQVNELSPISGSMPTSGLNNGYVTPGYAATTASPWSPTLPTADVAPPHATGMPFETESQWGNGGNGATFIPGRGWIANPQPLQPLHSSGSSVVPRGAYAHVGGGR
jgi:hypothetical protein